MSKIIKFSGSFHVVIFYCFLLATCDNAHAQKPEIIDQVVVHREDGFFMGWPANNGIWMWEDGEIMVGFTRGPFIKREDFHHVEAPYHSWLARSQDGGYTWKTIDSEGFVSGFDPEGIQGDSVQILKEITEPLNFQDENVALRVIGNGYLQPKVSEAGFFYSRDRGSSWKGPFLFNGLSYVEELEGMELTPRTDYIIENKDTALFFLSARAPDTGMTDKPFVVRTTDGGMTFEFLSWIVDPSDPYRGVMSSTVKTSSGKLVSAIRRRDVSRGSDNPYCWIDVYSSEDNGENWEFVSRAGETGWSNGNPPALIELSDGRLLVAYGNREHRQIRARFSSDKGKIWGPELILREGSEQDLGYPRLVQNKDGHIVTFYYWADSPDSEKYIAATVWNPGNGDSGKPVYLSKKL